jgi:hypothetical protein
MWETLTFLFTVWHNARLQKAGAQISYAQTSFCLIIKELLHYRPRLRLRGQTE